MYRPVISDLTLGVMPFDKVMRIFPGRVANITTINFTLIEEGKIYTPKTVSFDLVSTALDAEYLTAAIKWLNLTVFGFDGSSDDPSISVHCLPI
jgi:hypothetical protein